MESIELVLKETLTKPGDRLTYACFPQAGMI